MESTWRDLSALNDWDVSVHKYGLGASNRIVELLESEVLGQSTFGMKGSENVEEEEIIELPIRKTADVIKNITSNTPGNIDLLHVNCEGCEWEMLENIIKENLHHQIRIIQFSSHFFPQVEGITSRYCKIQEKLRESHEMVYGQSWGWERWDKIEETRTTAGLI